MVVGLPGTGIGGLFYLCMALWMPVHELWRLMHGRSSLARWRFIVFNWLIVAGILVTLWVTMLGMKMLVRAMGLDSSSGLLAGPELARETNQFFASAGWASGLSLVILVCIVQILRATVGRVSKLHPVRPNA